MQSVWKVRRLAQTRNSKAGDLLLVLTVIASNPPSVNRYQFKHVLNAFIAYNYNTHNALKCYHLQYKPTDTH